MSAISTILARLRAAIWAIDVRDDIANAIEQCYSDVSNPTLKTEALEAALQNKIDEGEMAALTIGDGTITGAKLANGTIPKAKLDPSITFDADATFDTTSTNAIQNKVVAGAISTLQADLGALSQGIMSDAAKDALMDCIEHIALWTDGQRDTYVETLRDALYPRTDLVSISAVYTPSEAVYTVDDVNIIKSNLVVTATYSDSTTEILEDGDYTLSGTLSEGTNTVTVYYNGKTTTVNVTVTGMRTAALTDVSTSKGVTGLTCTNGTFAKTSAVAFSAVIFNSGIKRARFTPNLSTTNNSQWIIFRQEDSGNICYGYNGGGITKFTWDGSKYAAVGASSEFNRITEGSGINDLSEKTVSVRGGNVAIVGASGSVTINNANCIGFWMSSTQNYLPTNTTFNKSE